MKYYYGYRKNRDKGNYSGTNIQPHTLPHQKKTPSDHGSEGVT
jgi:hypothetical protein